MTFAQAPSGLYLPVEPSAPVPPPPPVMVGCGTCPAAVERPPIVFGRTFGHGAAMWRHRHFCCRCGVNLWVCPVCWANGIGDCCPSCGEQSEYT